MKFLTEDDIATLGERYGMGTRNEDGSMLWFDGDPTDMVAAAESLVMERLALREQSLSQAFNEGRQFEAERLAAQKGGLK